MGCEQMHSDAIQSADCLVINAVYSPAVGHTIEALMVANAFRNCNSALHIKLLLNADTALELVSLAPRLRIETVAVSLLDYESSNIEAKILLPLATCSHYSYSLRDERHVNWENTNLKAFHVSFRKCFASRQQMTPSDGSATQFPQFMPSSLFFEFSPDQLRRAEQFCSKVASPRILILTGGATQQKAPECSFWRRLIRAIFVIYPTSEVILLGATRGSRVTQNISEQEINSLLADNPRVRSAFDLGIVTQLSIARRCDILISPHAGMAFAVQCVGVPWVALSGWMNHEYLSNGVPIASIYPNCPNYPCDRSTTSGKTILPDCAKMIQRGSGSLPCLAEAQLGYKIPEILETMQKLLSHKYSYRHWSRRHRIALRRYMKKPVFIENVTPSPLLERLISRRQINKLRFNRGLQETTTKSAQSQYP